MVKRLSLVAFTLVLFFLSSVQALPPDTGPAAPGGSDKPVVAPEFDNKEQPAANADKPKTDEKQRPKLTADELYKVKPSASEEKLQAAIDSLYRIIDIAEEDDPQKPAYYVRLAGLYWEKAETYFMQAYSYEMGAARAAAIDAGDQARIAEIDAKQNALLESQKEWRRKSVKIFVEVEQKYPDYERMDMVFFTLGNFLNQLGEKEQAFEYFKKLVTTFPSSSFVPDALVNLGEYYFDDAEFDVALEFYKRVEKFPNSVIYPYALYKQAWCYYNIGEHNMAFTKFVEVLEYTAKLEAKGTPPKLMLKAESQRDIVLVYSRMGAPDKAIGFFKSIAPEVYLQLSELLAERYFINGDFKLSVDMYRLVIAEVPDSPKILSYQRAIVDATDSIGDPEATRREILKLVEIFETLQAQNSSVVAEEAPKVEIVLSRIAIEYHKLVQKNPEEKYMNLAQEAYGQYLRLFPKGEGRYEMLWNHAVLLYNMNRYADAVVEFEAVLALEPQGKHTSEAARSAMFCYVQLASKEGAVTIGDDSDVERKELPAMEEATVRAAERYLTVGDVSTDDLVQAIYTAGITLYKFNHFAEAAVWFARILENHPNSDEAPDAARLLLSSYALARDIKSLYAWADKIWAMPSLQKADIQKQIEALRNEAKFNECFEYEGNNEFERAAECFMSYAVNFPKSPLIDKSYYNAGANYIRAKKYEKAIKANEALYTCCAKSSKLGPRALYGIAFTYMGAAAYEAAAQYYEEYVKRHPKEADAAKALSLAADLREGLGQYDLAVKDFELYISMFKNDPKNPEYFLRIGLLLTKQKQYPKAEAHYKKYIKNYGKAGGIVLLLVANRYLGELYIETRKGDDAKKAYAEVIRLFEALSKDEKKALGARGINAVAWAYFHSADDLIEEAGKIRYTRKGFDKESAEKLGKIQRAVAMLDAVSRFGIPYWTVVAQYRIGAAMERFAAEYEEAPLPPDLTPDEVEQVRAALAETTTAFRERSIAAFTKCLEDARKYRIFNEYTDQAEAHLAQVDFTYAGLKEYRVRPEYFTRGTSLPAFRYHRVVQTESQRAKEPGTPGTGGATQPPSTAPNEPQPANPKPDAGTAPGGESK